MFILLRKHSLLISILFLLVILISAWQLPSVASIFVVGFILFSITISISSIMEKHKSLPLNEARRRIAKDITIFVSSIAAAILLGGIAGQFAGSYAKAYMQAHWPGLDVIAGLLAAMLAAFAIGFAIRWSIRKATRS